MNMGMDMALGGGEWSGSTMGFGAPESVIDRRELFDMFQVYSNGRWYEPAISQIGIGRAYRVAPHHQSAILLKRNLLEFSFIETPLLSSAEFSKLALDYLIFGNAYAQMVRNVFGRPLSMLRSPAAWTRVGVQPGMFWFITPHQIAAMGCEPLAGEVFHIKEEDPLQEVYGMPSYISALQSGLLAENATLFRRRYYLNGMHAGFILYIAEENFSDADKTQLIEQMRRSKGPGNFRNLLLAIPKGKKDGVQILPISQIGAADEFSHIKEVTRDDLLAAHRVPPQLEGIVPKNGTGFGNVIDAVRAFYAMEIVPLQRQLMRINREVGAEVIKFAMPEELANLDPANPSVKG